MVPWIAVRLRVPRVIRVVESESGAQVLPPVRDQRQTIAGYHAHCMSSGDLRTKSKAHAVLAGRLLIVKENV